MTEAEKAVYLQVYTATIQGVHAHGQLLIAGDIRYRGNTALAASHSPLHVHEIAVKQANLALKHFREL